MSMNQNSTERKSLSCTTDSRNRKFLQEYVLICLFEVPNKTKTNFPNLFKTRNDSFLRCTATIVVHADKIKNYHA